MSMCIDVLVISIFLGSLDGADAPEVKARAGGLTHVVEHISGQKGLTADDSSITIEIFIKIFRLSKNVEAKDMIAKQKADV